MSFPRLAFRRIISFSHFSHLFVIILLSSVANGAQPNENVVKETAPLYILHNAVMQGNQSEVNRLLDEGISVDQKNQKGATPLHIASFHSNIAIAGILIVAGAYIDAKTFEAVTPLHIAVEQENIAMIKLLLAEDANINAKTEQGVTPLHFAAYNGNTSIVEILLNAGANINAKNIRNLTPAKIALQKGFRSLAGLISSSNMISIDEQKKMYKEQLKAKNQQQNERIAKQRSEHSQRMSKQKRLKKESRTEKKQYLKHAGRMFERISYANRLISQGQIHVGIQVLHDVINTASTHKVKEEAQYALAHSYYRASQYDSTVIAARLFLRTYHNSNFTENIMRLHQKAIDAKSQLVMSEILRDQQLAGIKVLQSCCKTLQRLEEKWFTFKGKIAINKLTNKERQLFSHATAHPSHGDNCSRQTTQICESAVIQKKQDINNLNSLIRAM